MLLSVVVTGHNKRDDLTIPCVRSFQRFMPDVPVMVVDVASDPEYNPISHVQMLYLKENNIPTALNYAYDRLPDSDWFMWMNNDTITNANFTDALQFLEPDAIYSEEMRNLGNVGLPEIEYVAGGFFLYPMQLIEEVGAFDRRFDPFLFDDIDYCYRAVKAGYHLKTIHLPITHLGCNGENPDKKRRQIYYRNLSKFLEKHDL